VNDTRVLPARLIGTRQKTEGRWEGLFLGFGENNLWRIIGKTRGHLQLGERVELRTPEGRLSFSLEFVSRLDDKSWIVRPLTDDDGITALHKVGWVPIPPYIRGGLMVQDDKQDYQTVYAQNPGAVAAPTAGLHFTPQLVEAVKNLGTKIIPVTLHVGIGTFRPIMVENIEEHDMHSEWCSVTENAVTEILNCRNNGGRIVAVGTTSVRVLESASQASPSEPRPSGSGSSGSNNHSLTVAALKSDAALKPFEGETSLFIRPPYQFKSVDMLLTNFHQPKSTLLILVRTFGGDELLQEVYREAIREKYRFFSYGDAMLIL
jgi:S-adenosylmethionine:tRNA ribosyltransferase-isomerase